MNILGWDGEELGDTFKGNFITLIFSVFFVSLLSSFQVSLASQETSFFVNHFLLDPLLFLWIFFLIAITPKIYEKLSEKFTYLDETLFSLNQVLVVILCIYTYFHNINIFVIIFGTLTFYFGLYMYFSEYDFEIDHPKHMFLAYFTLFACFSTLFHFFDFDVLIVIESLKTSHTLVVSFFLFFNSFILTGIVSNSQSIDNEMEKLSAEKHLGLLIIITIATIGFSYIFSVNPFPLLGEFLFPAIIFSMIEYIHTKNRPLLALIEYYVLGNVMYLAFIIIIIAIEAES